MNRIIINNESDLSDMQSLELIKIVIASGRVSNDNKQYCCLTEINRLGSVYKVWTSLLKSGDSFTIVKSKQIKL